MKTLRIYIRGPHLRWVDMPIPSEADIGHWTMVLQQQGCIVAPHATIFAQAVDMMVILDPLPSNNVTQLKPVS